MIDNVPVEYTGEGVTPVKVSTPLLYWVKSPILSVSLVCTSFHIMVAVCYDVFWNTKIVIAYRF